MPKKATTQNLNIPKFKITAAEFIIGGTCMVVHAWDGKTRREFLEKKLGYPQPLRGPSDPEAEFEAAKYKDHLGREGFLCSGLRKAIIAAASFVEDATKVHLRGTVFVMPTDPDAISQCGRDMLLFHHSQKGVMREDLVRVANGAPDLRFRPEYRNWSTTVRIQYNPNAISAAQLAQLMQIAGFAIGLNEGRPQKDGDGSWGRFELLKKVPAKPKKVHKPAITQPRSRDEVTKLTEKATAEKAAEKEAERAAKRAAAKKAKEAAAAAGDALTQITKEATKRTTKKATKKAA